MSNDFKAMKAVYTYFFPEVRSLVKSVASLEDDLFLVTTPIEKAQSIIDNLGFKKRLIIPSNSGFVDLDRIHEPIISRVVESYKPAISGLEEFNFSYPTSGSSEGIFHILSELRAKGVRNIYTIAGEYEGYREYGKALGMETIEVEFGKTDLGALKEGVWFISNPSAKDGNILPNGKINEIADLGHKIILDLAYAGSTRPYKFNVSHKNIEKVVMSFSKPYGLFRFRIGFTFSRNEIPSLYGNKWFKDVQRFILAAKVAEEIGPSKLYPIYNPRQKEIVSHLNNKFGLRLRPSDALLIANFYGTDKLSDEQKRIIEPFKRGGGFRFCLTPYYEELEKGGLK
jgi:hypothetical protein